MLIYPNPGEKDAITLTTEEVERLQSNDFLNDSLVDYELKRIQIEELTEDKRARCHFFNSFFYKRLHNAVGSLRRVDQSNPESLRAAYDTVKR